MDRDYTKEQGKGSLTEQRSQGTKLLL